MHYFALLLHPERTTPPSPDQQAVEMAEWERFHELAAPAIRAGDALAPAADDEERKRLGIALLHDIIRQEPMTSSPVGGGLWGLFKIRAPRTGRVRPI